MDEQEYKQRKDIDGRTIEEVDRDLEGLVQYLERIGVHKLAREVSDERFARRMLENQRWIDGHEYLVAAEERLQESLEQRIVAMQSQMFDKAAAYNNIIVTLGYAGFFAIWTFTKDNLATWDTVLIAALLGTSLMLFIAWTLGISMVNARLVQRMGAVLNAEYESREDKVAAAIAFETKHQKKLLRVLSVWMPVFYMTVFTGFSAGLILLSLLFGQVIGFEFSYHELLEKIRN